MAVPMEHHPIVYTPAKTIAERHVRPQNPFHIAAASAADQPIDIVLMHRQFPTKVRPSYANMADMQVQRNSEDEDSISRKCCRNAIPASRIRRCREGPAAFCSGDRIASAVLGARRFAPVTLSRQRLPLLANP
jgi:hypothetical protein